MTTPAHPEEIVIYGTTSNGKTFRPSDWAERLCGILSSFDKDHRLAYHQWVRPLLVGKIRSVAVGRQLETINPPMFRFLMDFAADNDLRVLDADALAALEAAPPAAATPQTAPEAAPSPEEARFAVREIAAGNTAAAHAALAVLHPDLGDAHRFAEHVDTELRPAGYRLFGVFESGKNNAAAVCGLRTLTGLGALRRIVIEDLATVPPMRRKGCAALLLHAAAELAAAENAATLEADLPAAAPAQVQSLFARHGFTVRALHFSRPAA